MRRKYHTKAVSKFGCPLLASIFIPRTCTQRIHNKARTTATNLSHLIHLSTASKLSLDPASRPVLPLGTLPSWHPKQISLTPCRPLGSRPPRPAFLVADYHQTSYHTTGCCHCALPHYSGRTDQRGYLILCCTAPLYPLELVLVLVPGCVTLGCGSISTFELYPVGNLDGRTIPSVHCWPPPA